MGSFSNKESVLLACSPQKPSLNSFPKNPCRNSDIDFNDVFGGPPRQASIQETRCSFGEATDSYSLKGEDETMALRWRWSGLNEKPVFGDECGYRSRHPAGFFDDIFKGSEFLMSSSPRRHSQDPFSSSPGSRALSPVRPLSPRAEALLSSSVPSQFSLPAKLFKGTESPIFGSSNHYHHKNNDGALNGFSSYSCSPLSRLSCQTIPPQEELTNNDCQQRSLADEPSLSWKESPNLSKINETDRGSTLKRDSKFSVPANPSQFHFSIYKWATKGMPLAMPFRKGNSSRLKEKVKFERCASTDGLCEGVVRGLHVATPQGIASPLFDTGISSNAKFYETEPDKQANVSLMDASTMVKLEQLQIPEGAILPETKSEAAVKNDDFNTMLHNSIEERKPQSVPDMAMSGKIDKEISTEMNEAPRTELKKPLCSLFHDTDPEHGFDEVTTKNKYKEGKVKSTKRSSAVFGVSDIAKKEDRKGNASSGKETDKANWLQENLEKNRVEGKVKEFVKIFNEEASNKTKFDADYQDQDSRCKDGGKFGRGDEATIITNKIKDGMNLPNKNKKYTANASAMVEEICRQSEKENSQRTGNNKPIKASSEVKDILGTTADGSEAVAGDTDDTFLLIRELHLDEDKLPQTDDTHEELHIIDGKIRKWSDGKERNIRSLLSTLQYVLWSESGWKPVPLADLIEGNAVKRSYQKALLCLHPDKLQQKGVTSHEKYMAEKVFDILQVK
uniref:J domain-containing protein required for chloroplast accumulation response 1 n=1 Tax=Rhizophora mucronata TaxID=61149 RepID=A0A2P2KMA0_RHIMU